MSEVSQTNEGGGLYRLGCENFQDPGQRSGEGGGGKRHCDFPDGGKDGAISVNDLEVFMNKVAKLEALARQQFVFAVFIFL